jgi:hypothetical protein
MSKDNNLTDFLTDVADAIREKKGTADKINPQNFSDEIKGIKTSIWTGHADVEGLKAIGWDDEDIAYYQEHGVNWMEEDDEYHKVSDDNKALYGVLTAGNIQEYKDRIVYLPKINTSGRINFDNFFENCNKMIAIPKIDTSSANNMYKMFCDCYLLSYIPLLDTSKVSSILQFAQNCYSLHHVADIDTRNVTSCEYAFRGCRSLRLVPNININGSNSIEYMFQSCYSLKSASSIHVSANNITSLFHSCYSLEQIGEIDLSNVTKDENFMGNSYCLKEVKLKGINKNIDVSAANTINKQSILYAIENEVATSPITITLAFNSYARLATDPDIVAALENHPLVSLASA